MNPVFKYLQRRLKELGYYRGRVDGVIGPKTETALLRVHFIARTGYRRERLALAYLQTLINDAGASPPLKVDGLMGPVTRAEYDRVARSEGLPASPARIQPSGQYLMPGVTFDPFHNLPGRPEFTPHGVVLHRTAGYFTTGDYRVGKWGHPGGPGRKRSSLSFHFLVGKEPGEVVQFVPIDRMVHHVKRHSDYYLGIEISGDVGLNRDGYQHGEPMTEWQLGKVVEILGFIRSTYPDIRAERCESLDAMFQVGEFPGLVGHRDLTGNDHADSPNRRDWGEILGAL